jgi:probable rRNA maturation factor
MTIEIEVQNVTGFGPVPDDGTLGRWAAAALQDRREAELTLRLVDEPESRALNKRYRGKSAPTNVLSFPSELPAELEIPLLGDIVICAPLVAEEASSQGKPAEAHWAHLVIHGVLHLLGHDHQEEAEAGKMEALEIELLASLGFPNPYE